MRKTLLVLVVIMLLAISGCTKEEIKEEPFWKVSEYNPISSEEYFSVEHFFDENSKNLPVQVSNNRMVRAYGTTDGIVVHGFVDDEHEFSQYMLKGDYSNYMGANGGDGYWFYFIKNNSQLVRVNVNGEEQAIAEVKCEDTIEMKIYDQDLMYLLYWKGDMAVVDQIYMSDMSVKETEAYRKDEMIGDYDIPALLVPKSSDYITYRVLNDKFREKYEELKNDPDTLYEMLTKNGYTGQKEEAIENYSLGDLVNSIYEEYGITYQQRVDYNIKSGISDVSDEVYLFDMSWR